MTAASSSTQHARRGRAAPASLIAAPASRSSSQSGSSATTAARLARIVVVARRTFARSWSFGEREPAPPAGTGADGAPRAASLIGARISARCSARTGARCRSSPPPMCIRHELSQAHTASAPGRLDARRACRRASRSTRPRSSPRTCRRSRSTPRRPAARAAPARARRAAAAAGASPRSQQPQRVAGRVVGDRAVEGRADVLDPEPVDEELESSTSRARPSAPRAPATCVATCAGAGRRTARRSRS